MPCCISRSLMIHHPPLSIEDKDSCMAPQLENAKLTIVERHELQFFKHRGRQISKFSSGKCSSILKNKKAILSSWDSFFY